MIPDLEKEYYHFHNDGFNAFLLLMGLIAVGGIGLALFIIK